MWSFRRFSLHNTLVVASDIFLSYENTGGFKPLESPPGGGGAPQPFTFFSACIIHDGLRLPMSDVSHCCAQVATPLFSKPVFFIVVDALAQFPTPPSRLFFSVALDTLERFLSPSARPCFYQVIGVGEITPLFYSIPFLFPLFYCWGSVSFFLTFWPLLPWPTSISLGLCTPMKFPSPWTGMFHYVLIGTRRHFSSWLDAHEFILRSVDTTELSWRGSHPTSPDTPPCDTPNCFPSIT